MPIYAYQCQACDHKLEAIQKLSDEPLQVCPACNERKLVKQVTAGRFRLTGSGWYETDFKTGNRKNLAGDQSGADSGGGSDKDKKAPPAAPSAATATAKADAATPTTPAGG